MIKTDVLVIGGGLAGLSAAYAAQAEGVKVILIDRGNVGLANNSYITDGTFATPTEVYSAEAYSRRTIEIGKSLGHIPLVRQMAEHAPEAIQFLKTLGLTMEEYPEVFVVIPSEIRQKPGMAIMKSFLSVISKCDRITLMSHFYVTDICVDQKQVTGVYGFDSQGKEIFFQASSVILATGGAGALYPYNALHKNCLGQGYYVAAKAGLKLWDMEFVQFFPFVNIEPGFPKIELAPVSEHTKVVNASGEDILKDYGISDLQDAMMKQRDMLSVILYQALEKGPIYMDYRAVPSQTWEWEDFKHALAISPVLKERPVRISPGAHFFMGGVRIREDAGTDLAGLFACGEAASGVHGANRRGGNSLTECMVFGKIAGTQAAAYAYKNKSRHLNPPLPEINTKSCSKSSALDFQYIKRQIQTIAWQYAGIIRWEEGLNIGLSRIEEIDQKLAGASYNTAVERRHLEDLKAAAFTLKAVIHASLGRKESRGAFRRSDFPSEDKDYQKNADLTYRREENTFSVEQYPV